MLAKQQSSKWKYLKLLSILPATALLMVLFAFNLSGELPEPIVEPLEKIEKEISDMAQQSVLSASDKKLPLAGPAKQYTLKWGDLECECRNEQFPNYYHCENQSLLPRQLKRLIRKEGGFQVFLDDQPQAITELKAVSKYMKDMGGYQGQFDEMETSFNTESPLWKQAEKGDVFRFTFSNGSGDYFEFDVVINNRREDFVFGSRVELGDYQFNINLTNDRGIVHMDVEDLQRLAEAPLRVLKNNDGYYQLHTAKITNREAIRQDEWKAIRKNELDISKSKAIEEAFPGDRIHFSLESEAGEKIQFDVLLRKNSSWNGRKRDLAVYWGDRYFESRQIGILTKKELLELKEQEMYLHANGRKHLMRDKTVESNYVLFPNNKPQVKNRTVHGVSDYLEKSLDRLEPGHSLNLNWLKTVDGYLTPNLVFYVDFDWKEVFANHPNVRVLENNTLVIEPAQQEDLERLLNLNNFRTNWYKIQVDNRIYERKYGYVLEGEKTVIENTPEKIAVKNKIVVSRIDCLNCK